MKINGERRDLWRAVDPDGEMLAISVTKNRDKNEALKFFRKTMRNHGRTEEIVTDKLRSYGVALKEVHIARGRRRADG
ncbi:hypothetical protein ROA7450_03968 [Roseovarius albus]|uniref:DDE domain-containing protein n=1 Tax=Roseovarius albus TaxID=1247867 RepID=A0A1X7A6W5_9RHOB|nr:hypothetical protein ROA7450_03968 [Roseovarius albus]